MDFHRIKLILSQHTPSHLGWKGAALFLCNENYVFLTKRSIQMPTHGGQIAFIGGYRKTSESHPWDVVQREFEEETLLDRGCLECLGYLAPVQTANEISVIPVMAKLNIEVKQFLDSVKSNGEWDSVIAYPWDALKIEKDWQYAWRQGVLSKPILFHPLKSKSLFSSNDKNNSELLWGATAEMIWDFLRLYFNK